jgi:hypothetical protein
MRNAYENSEKSEGENFIVGRSIILKWILEDFIAEL